MANFRWLTAAAMAWALAGPAFAAPTVGSIRGAIVTSPEHGLRQAEALQRLGDRVGADLLRAGLLQAQLMPTANGPLRAEELIANAARLGPLQASPLAALWATRFNRDVVLTWLPKPEVLPPQLGFIDPAATPVGTGLWARDEGSAGAELSALVRLDNRGAQPLPLLAFTLQLRRAAATATLDCIPPTGPMKGRVAPALADAGEQPAPGAGRPFLCRGTVAAEWAAVATRLSNGQPADGETAVLQPVHLASAGGVEALLRSLAAPVVAVAPQAVAQAGPALPSQGTRGLASTWRVAAAVGAAAALLLMLLRTLHARIDGDETASRAWVRSLPAAGGVLLVAGAIGSPWGQQLLGAIGDAASAAMRALMARFPMEGGSGSGVPGGAGGRLGDSMPTLFVLWTLGLYGAGRLMLRVGTRPLSVTLFTWTVVLLLGPLTAASLWSPPSGDGWSRAMPLVMVAMAMWFFIAVGIAVTLLHRMDDWLDREGTTWPATVITGLKRALDFRSAATRAEFWGYLVFFALAWMSTRLLARPLDVAVAAVFLLPVPALLLRRLRGLSEREALGLALLLLLVMAEFVMKR